MIASTRPAAIVAMLALPLILFVSVAYESGRVPMGQAFRSSAPTVALGALPLLWIIWQLRNGPDRFGLAVGIAFPALVFGIVAVALLRMIMGNSEQQMNFMMTVFFFWTSRSMAVFGIIFLPALGWLLVSSARAMATISERGNAQLILTAFAVTALIVVVPLRIWKPVARPQLRSFRADQSLYAFRVIYPCLWRIAGPDGSNGFPTALTELSAGDRGAQNPACAGWKQYENETHSITYRRRGSGFVLTISERARRGAPSIQLSVDETGIVRETLFDEAGREVEKERKILNVDPLVNLFLLSENIERYARANPEIGYPPRLAGGGRDGSDANDILRLNKPFESGVTDIPRASCLLVEGRTLIYTPAFDAHGRATSYSIAVLPRLPRELAIQLELHQMRSYLRNERGVVHGTGAPRGATEADPVIPGDEQTVAATRAAKRMKNLDEDRAREAKYRAQNFRTESR